MSKEKKILTQTELSSLGGKANFKKRGKKFYSKIGKLGCEARWGKKKLVKK